ncbi:hypothetical protein [Piscinibacterium candidicorallinum]|uniref:DUF3566 domain-containing protein n=1 Tax=Piscinibacterium candidicorallinum TaxID=1793872 RepID=A0ABV7H928_9BURK
MQGQRSGYQEFRVERIATGSVFKLLGAGLVFSLVPFATVMGVLALAGANTVTWNGKALTGFTGLAASPLIGFFLALFFTALLGVCMAAGLWLYSRFWPLELRLRLQADSTAGQSADPS